MDALGVIDAGVDDDEDAEAVSDLDSAVVAAARVAEVWGFWATVRLMSERTVRRGGSIIVIGIACTPRREDAWDSGEMTSNRKTSDGITAY